MDEKKEKKSIEETVNKRIGKKLADYIEYIQKRFLDEYGIKVAFTEASNLLVGRAKEKRLF